MLKRYSLGLIIICLIGVLSGCSTDSASAGSSILEEADDIVVDAKTFAISSALLEGTDIYSTSDSLLLGECDNKFGTLHADILTQLACPEGFVYPEGAEVDSVNILLYYTSWYGDGLSPLTLNIYEMDGEVLGFTNRYSCFEDLNRFCTAESRKKSIVVNPRTILAQQPTDSVYNSATSKYVGFVSFRATDEFTQRFFQNKDFSSQEAFNQHFKGLYITSQFGGSTILHVNNVSLVVYYHYEYTQNGDTVKHKEADAKGFYGNTEIRQINRYEYINSQIENLRPLADSVNYIVSPGNIFTSLQLPIKEMCDSIQTRIGSKRAYINQAQIKVEVLNYYKGETKDMTLNDWAQPASYMLLIPEDESEEFFKSGKLPNDTTSLLKSLVATTDSANVTTYSYNFDLSNMLTKQLRAIERDSASVNLLPDVLNMVLVPVDVTTSQSATNGSATISSVKHKQTVSVTAVKSANASDAPMMFEVVFSGF